tara:strand:+ start:1705 stop:2088 length:384 start_codon:yes stop_codon:yes gene_type:complete
MRIKSIKTNEKKIISSYDNEGFVISGQNFIGSVFVFPDKVISINLKDINTLTIEMLAPLEDANPHIDLIIFGFSKAIEKELDSSIKNYLLNKNIYIEFMETGSACRTYNLLSAEGRNVAAVLLPGQK